MKLSGNIVSVIFNVLSAFELTAKHTRYTFQKIGVTFFQQEC